MIAYRKFGRISSLGLLLTLMVTGCSSHPTYYKEITTKYDANGKQVGTEVKEGISQKSRSTHSLIVNLSDKKQLEIE